MEPRYSNQESIEILLQRVTFMLILTLLLNEYKRNAQTNDLKGNYLIQQMYKGIISQIRHIRRVELLMQSHTAFQTYYLPTATPDFKHE